MQTKKNQKKKTANKTKKVKSIYSIKKYKLKNTLKKSKSSKISNGGGKCEDVLGEGNYGIVYKCKKDGNNTAYALKINKDGNDVKNNGSESAQRDQMSINEKNILFLLSKPGHPNIIKIIDSEKENFSFENKTFSSSFLMELGDMGLNKLYDQESEEGTLIKKSEYFNDAYFMNPKSLDFTYDIFTQLLSGLCYLYEKHICHFDIKPDNILVKKEGNKYIYKITDFGLAVEITDSNFKTLGLEKPVLFQNPADNGNGLYTYGTGFYIPAYKDLSLGYTLYFRDLYALYCTLYWVYNDGTLFNKDVQALNPIEVDMNENANENSNENDTYENLLYKTMNKTDKTKANYSNLNNILELFLMLQYDLLDIYSKEKGLGNMRPDEKNLYKVFYASINKLLKLEN